MTENTGWEIEPSLIKSHEINTAATKQHIQRHMDPARAFRAGASSCGAFKQDKSAARCEMLIHVPD